MPKDVEWTYKRWMVIALFGVNKGSLPFGDELLTLESRWRTIAHPLQVDLFQELDDQLQILSGCFTQVTHDHTALQWHIGRRMRLSMLGLR